MDRLMELERLAKLRAEGVLTDEEFVIEKQRVLSGTTKVQEASSIEPSRMEQGRGPRMNIPYLWPALLAVFLVCVFLLIGPRIGGSDTEHVVTDDNASAPIEKSKAGMDISSGVEVENSAAPIAPNLASYLGKYPNHKVNGIRFLQNNLVRSAIGRAVADEHVRNLIYHTDVVQTPIARAGGKLLAFGCRPRSCDTDSWTLIVDDEGSRAEVCVNQTDPVDGSGGVRWYADGSLETRSDDCPVDDATRANVAKPNF